MRTKKLILTVFIACFMPAAATTLTLDEVVAKTTARYADMNSFHAKFEQVLCDENSGTCSTYEGEVYYLKPNFVRMEIANPPQIYVGDSVSLWIYFPDRKQAIRQPLEQVPFAVNPDIFLKDYQERFSAVLETRGTDYVIVLTPLEEAEMFGRIAVEVSGATFAITGISIQDGAGMENKFVFTDIALNRKISRNKFKFEPPAGTEIID